jgi:hypothetical protein
LLSKYQSGKEAIYMKSKPLAFITCCSMIFILTTFELDSLAAAMEMNGDVAVTGILSATTFSGSGSGLSNIPGSAIAGTSITVNQLADGAVTPVKIGFLGKVAVVAVSGGDYTNPATAMVSYIDWCGTPSETNPCLLKIMPGVYDVGTSSVVMQPYIDIEGSGENTTVITGAVSNASFPPVNGVVNGVSNAEIRFLTVRYTGTGVGAAVLNSGGSPRMTHMTAVASGGTWTQNYGVYNYASSSPAMSNVTASASGGTEALNYGVYNYASSSPAMSNVTATASGGRTSMGVVNIASSPTMSNVTATASGGTYNYGLNNAATSGSYTIKIDRSTFSGSTNSIRNDSEFTLMIGASNLTGGDVNALGTYHCVGVYDGDTYTALGANCQ